jgi:hypothetical protein
MKCNAAIAALMLAMGLSTPSFGANLLDQMLSLRTSGRGCCATSCQTNCCPTACAPACGHDAACAPACGCDNACQPACQPACGCDRGHGLGLGLFSGRGNKCCHNTCGCDAQACCPPACGCDHGAAACGPAACGCDHGASACCQDSCCPTSCCKKKRTSLLDLIFGNRCRKSCNSCNACDSCCGQAVSACGCGGDYHGAPGPMMDDGAPVPPAPMVDPAAYVPAQRRVVHAGVNLLR